MLPGTMLEAGPQGANVRSGPGTQYPVLLAAKPGAAAPATGKEKPVGTKTWYEVEAEQKKGWVSSGVVKVRPPQDDTDKARIALKAIVTYDKQLHELGVAILKKLVDLQRKGVNVEIHKKEFVRIATEFVKRQKRLQEKLPAGQITTEATQGMKAIQAYLNELNLKGVGFLSLIPIVVGIYAGIRVANMLGFMKEEYGNSVKNLKESETLKKALDSLTPAEREEVRADLENQIDTAYGSGVQDEKDKDFLSKVKKYALIGGVVLLGIYSIPMILPMKR